MNLTVSELSLTEEHQPSCEETGSTINRCLRERFYYVCILQILIHLAELLRMPNKLKPNNSAVAW